MILAPLHKCIRVTFKKHTATLWNYMHTQTSNTYHFLSTIK